MINQIMTVKQTYKLPQSMWILHHDLTKLLLSSVKVTENLKKYINCLTNNLTLKYLIKTLNKAQQSSLTYSALLVKWADYQKSHSAGCCKMEGQRKSFQRPWLLVPDELCVQAIGNYILLDVTAICGVLVIFCYLFLCSNVQLSRGDSLAGRQGTHTSPEGTE